MYTTLFRSEGRPFIWAHRGARSLAPENTLAAGRQAKQAGADGWEVDVRLTKDGSCVLLHDLGILRTTDFKRRHDLCHISPAITPNLTLEQMLSLDAGAWFATSDPFGQMAMGGISLAQAEAYQGEPVPSLGQALDLSRELGLPINVEFKRMRGHGQGNLVEKAALEIRSRGMADMVLVSSFSLRYLERFRRICPEVPAVWLTHSLDVSTAHVLAELGLVGVHLHHRGATPELVQPLLDRGWLVNLYTVNDPMETKRFMAEGISGIITDLPQTMRGLIGSKAGAKALSC